MESTHHPTSAPSPTQTSSEIPLMRDPLPKAQIPLHIRMQSADKKKRLYDPKNMWCKMCFTEGHTYEFCNARNTIPTDEQRHPFVDDLINSPPADLSIYENLSLEATLQLFLREGQRINEHNPLKDSKNAIHSLAKEAGYWKALGAPGNVLSWLCYGLTHRFFKEPLNVQYDNWPSFEEEKEWVSPELQKQVDLGRFNILKQNDRKPKMIHASGVIIKIKEDGTVKYRRVDDMREQNGWSASHAHKFESLRIMAILVEQGDVLWNIDLSDFYYQLMLSPDSRQWYCFSDGERIYQSSVLLFGSKPASFWCTKINRPILKFFRAAKLKTSNYLDDWTGAAKPEQGTQTYAFVLSILTRLGWKINTDKSTKELKTSTIHLGMEVDSALMGYRIPPRKKQTVLSELREVISTAKQNLPTTQKKLARLLGLCQSLKIACPEIMIWIRSLYKLLKNDQPGDTPIHIPGEELSDLLETEQQILHNDHTTFKTLLPLAEIEVDASETGIGAVLTLTANAATPEPMAELLPTELIGTSSTRRELRGTRRALEHYANKITASTDIRPIPVRVKMDSQASVKILLKKGSPVPLLNAEIKTIAKICKESEFAMLPDWIERSRNKRADELSKLWSQVDINQLNPLIVFKLQNQIFPGREIKLLPYGGIARFVRHRKHTSGRHRLILIHPVWTAQYWWPILEENRVDFADIGTYNFVFLTPKAAPQWNFQASLI